MPTFHDPLADAAEAPEALRVSHTPAASSTSPPTPTYQVIGELVAGVRSVRQVLDQLANAHLAHRARAHHDDGNHLAGAHSALAAADELHQAGTLLDQADTLAESGTESRDGTAMLTGGSSSCSCNAPRPTRRWT